MRSFSLTMDVYHKLPEAERQAWDAWVAMLAGSYWDCFAVDVKENGGVEVTIHRYRRNEKGCLELDETGEAPMKLPPFVATVPDLPSFVGQHLAA